jgi:flagellar biosynthesis chaperone FliJ
VNNPLVYPLEQLMTIKQNRFDAAVKILEQKKEILEKAKKKLDEAIFEKDQVAQHKAAKLDQIRQELDQGTTSDKVQQARIYLKVVDERLAEKEKAVKVQQNQVDIAESQVDAATQEVYQKKKDLEKLQMHKQEWKKEVRYRIEQKEAIEQDDQGSAAHFLRKKEEEKRKKGLGNEQ